MSGEKTDYMNHCGFSMIFWPVRYFSKEITKTYNYAFYFVFPALLKATVM